MNDFLIIVTSVCWLGILTAISPCPLATNIAAISFVSKKITNPKRVFWAGIFYATGRGLTYTVLSSSIAYFVLSTPEMSHFLQKYTTMILGPILIIVGMILLNLLSFNVNLPVISHNNQSKIGDSGLWGAFALGVIFALSFCPISAAIFFVSLLPIIIKSNSPVTLSLIYGISTSLPVLVFSFSISLSAEKIAKRFNVITIFDKWARGITGIVFILVGIYYTLVSVY